MDEPFLGQIAVFPYTYAPRGWSMCEGQLLSIEQYTALFSLLGTNFGGDGKTTFALPDLRKKEPSENIHYYIAMEGIYPPRD